METLNHLSLNVNAEEKSSFTFEDAISFIGADYAVAA